MKPIYGAPAAVILTVLSVPAIYGTADAAKFRICKTVASTGANASNSLAITAARRGGRNSRNIWNVTFQQRMCRTR